MYLFVFDIWNDECDSKEDQWLDLDMEEKGFRYLFLAECPKM